MVLQEYLFCLSYFMEHATEWPVARPRRRPREGKEINDIADTA